MLAFHKVSIGHNRALSFL